MKKLVFARVRDVITLFATYATNGIMSETLNKKIQYVLRKNNYFFLNRSSEYPLNFQISEN